MSINEGSVPDGNNNTMYKHSFPIKQSSTYNILMTGNYHVQHRDKIIHTHGTLNSDWVFDYDQGTVTFMTIGA